MANTIERVSVQQENNSTTFFDHSKRKFSKRDVIGYFFGDFGNNCDRQVIFYSFR